MDRAPALDPSARFGGRKVLVTGGAGFIGTNLVQRLLCEQAAVTVLDDGSTGCLEGVPAADGRLELVRGSVHRRGPGAPTRGPGRSRLPPGRAQHHRLDPRTRARTTRPTSAAR